MKLHAYPRHAHKSPMTKRREVAEVAAFLLVLFLVVGAMSLDYQL